MDMMKQETQQNSEEQKNSSSGENSPLKACTECCTIKTPLWRGGPQGPKSLCNACGIKYNKKRREELGLEVVKKKKRSSEVTEILEMLQNMPVGNEAMEEKSQCLMSKLGDEERAAILLMNLSCGSALA